MFVNVVGGLRVIETAVDLSVILAVLSSLRNKPMAADCVVFGEGFIGEIRPVPNGTERMNEAIKHGFKRIGVPKANCPKRMPDGVDVVVATHLSGVIQDVM